MQRFEATYRQHYQNLYRYVYRYMGQPACSEDIVQETFLRLYNQHQRKVPDNEKAWLYKVATNLALSQLSRQQRWNRLLPRFKASLPVSVMPEDPVEKAETARGVRNALAALPQRDQTLLLLFQEGMSYKEMAAVTGIKATSIGKLLSRAMERCSKELEKQL